MSTKILMLLDNAFTGDPRVSKEANTLVNHGYEVCVVCLQNSNNKKIETEEGIKIHRMLQPQIFQLTKRNGFSQIARDILSKFEFDIIHCHDYKMLDLGVHLKKVSKKLLVYDSHELLSGSPIHYLNSSISHKLKSQIARKIEIIIEKRNSKHVDAFITVGDNIKSILIKNLNIDGGTPFEVLRNTPPTKSLINQNERESIRKNLGFTNQDKLLVFIGKNFFPGKQNLEKLLEEMKNPITNVHLVLIGGKNNLQYFKNLTNSLGCKNTHFLGDVPSSKTHAYLCAMDIGILPLYNKTDLSYWNALPNKIFDYFMAGLPVITTSQPEYKKVIDESKAGLYINPDADESFIANAHHVMNDYDTFKTNALNAAKKLNWELEQHRLLSLYKSIESI